MVNSPLAQSSSIIDNANAINLTELLAMSLQLIGRDVEEQVANVNGLTRLWGRALRPGVHSSGVVTTVSLATSTTIKLAAVRRRRGLVGVPANSSSRDSSGPDEATGGDNEGSSSVCWGREP